MSAAAAGPSAPAGPAAMPGPAQRGEMSMVQKHHERVQAEKEEAGMGRLKLALPDFSPRTLALALHDCALDAERALMCLRQFQADRFEELEALRRRRSRQLAAQRAASASSGSASSSDSDSDSASDDRRGRHKKSKKHKRRRTSSGKRDKHKKEKHRREKDKRKKKRRREGDEGGGSRAFGSFGIIRESDYSLKKPEFAAWAQEVKDIDIEGLPRGDERELFLIFMEDYNTASLPHKKFYDLELYERRRAAREARRHPERAEAAVAAAGFVDDERLRRAEMAEQRRRELDQSAHEAYQRMMLSGSHLQELKEREMMQLQAQAAYKTGDMNKVQKLMNKLKPVEEDGPGEGGFGQ